MPSPNTAGEICHRAMKHRLNDLAQSGVGSIVTQLFTLGFGGDVLVYGCSFHIFAIRDGNSTPARPLPARNLHSLRLPRHFGKIFCLSRELDVSRSAPSGRKNTRRRQKLPLSQPQLAFRPSLRFPGARPLPSSFALSCCCSSRDPRAYTFGNGTPLVPNIFSSQAIIRAKRLFRSCGYLVSSCWIFPWREPCARASGFRRVSSA